MMPDREKYIEVLSKTAKTVKEFNEDTPIKISLQCVEDILELLKEQPQIVRCRDCKHSNTGNWCEAHMEHYPDDDWFCADGRRLE